ncbi:benomyl/methotrexate resistance protein [Lophiotrema nucula]|uniref:Benomyl/methotrexate resistance protein n=1 Tax=Lophiotrema nucula TaxID=690887 RepID=A0A6A5ZCN9_9PLEO|nr:benomyl/methotrexate resistance protein [Lophiotrema nucula]
MHESASRSTSTLESAIGDATSVDRREKEALPLDVDEEKAIGLERHSTGTSEEDEDIQARGDGAQLPHTKSLQSIKSQRSYAGGDGYTCFSENDERPSIPSGSTAERYLVTWEGDADPMNPRSMTTLRRWVIVLILASSSVCVQLIPEFNSSRLLCTLGLSLYVAGLGTGPMFLSPLSEFYGRRPIYIGSFLFFTIWLIPCAVAQNLQTMLVARFLDGLVGSAFLSVAGGTVGDCFAKHELSFPMMVYSAAPFVGPEIGPLVGGFIVQNTTWRWIFYVLIIWAGANLAMIVFFVPETYHPVLLRNKAIRLREETGNTEWIAPIEKLSRSITKTVLWSCLRPFQLLFFEPMCLNLCILSAILLGILYLFFGAFALVFQHNHGFNSAQLGLSFLGLLVGMLIGIASDPVWKRTYNRLVREEEAKGGGSEPEFRLMSTIFGAFVVPIGLFECPVQESSPSALAANSFARSCFAGAFPLFGVQMYNNLGYQWATTLLAFLALAMAP